jgi:phosphate transport system permease protein
MSAVALDERPPAPDVPGLPDLGTGAVSRGRRVRNGLASAAMAVAVLIAAVPLAAVMVVVISKGIGVIRADWFTKDIPANIASYALKVKNAEKFGLPPPPKPVYGMQPAIVGTIIITGLAALLAIPLGVLGAIYLNEYGKQKRLARFLRFLTDVMTGVPSVVMGVFVYTVWVLHYKGAGRSAIAGALALACLMLPIVVRATEEMLKLVPNHLREASAALGSRTWRTTTSVVVPAALPGITSGAMLAIARAAGETAPLLFTIGIVTHVNASLHGPNTALSTQIFSNATQPGGESLAWGAALTLIAIVLACTLIARLVASRFALR